MRRFVNLSMWVLSAAMLFTTACIKDNGPQDIPVAEPDPGKNLELVLSVGEVTSSTVTFTITPNLEDAPYYAQLYPVAELTTERDVAVAAALMTMEKEYVGKQTITVEELAAGSEYKVLYFGYDAEAKMYTTNYILSDIVKTADFVISESLAIEVVDDSATWRDALVKIAPSTEDMEYVFDFMDKAKWDELYAKNPEAIVGERIRLWELDVEYGIEEYPDLDTWQKYMQLYQHSGTKTVAVSEYYNLRWGAEYVMYAFGMSDDGYQMTNVVALSFETVAPQPSQNSFEIEIKELTATTVAFTVTAANDEPYFVSIQDKRYVARFGDGKDESWEDMIWDLTFCKTDDQIASYLFNGTQELTNESINKSVDALHEYQVLVWGFDEGPTTGVYVSEAFQPYDETVGLTLYMSIDDVTSNTLTCSVKVNSGVPTYYIGCISAEQFGNDYGLAYINSLYGNIGADELKVGSQTYTFEDLAPESEYYVIAFGYDLENAEPTTELEYESARTMPIATGDDFTISVSNITWRDAVISVATEIKDGYIFGVYTAEEFATLDANAILAKRKAIWEDYAVSYNSPWTNFMGYDMKYGNKTLNVKDDIQKLMWATDYVFYCMALDDAGNAVSQMATSEFSTITPTPSNCTFEITVDSMTSSSVDFTVAPSNPNEQYYVTVQRASVVDFYGPGKDKSYDELVVYLTPDYNNQIEQGLYTGKQSIVNSQLNDLYEYVVVVWGFDNGPTTTAFLSEVFTPVDPE